MTPAELATVLGLSDGSVGSITDATVEKTSGDKNIVSFSFQVDAIRTTPPPPPQLRCRPCRRMGAALRPTTSL